MYVCLCKGVTDTQIRAAVDQGNVSFNDVQQKLDVGTVCGTCSCEVKDIIHQRLNQALSANSDNSGFALGSRAKEIHFAV